MNYNLLIWVIPLILAAIAFIKTETQASSRFYDQNGIKEKHIVKKNSIIRKIPLFKWTEYDENRKLHGIRPLMYVRVVPFLINIIQVICIIILYALAFIFPESIFATFLYSDIGEEVIKYIQWGDLLLVAIWITMWRVG